MKISIKTNLVLGLLLLIPPWDYSNEQIHAQIQPFTNRALLYKDASVVPNNGFWIGASNPVFTQIRSASAQTWDKGNNAYYRLYTPMDYMSDQSFIQRYVPEMGSSLSGGNNYYAMIRSNYRYFKEGDPVGSFLDYYKFPNPVNVSVNSRNFGSRMLQFLAMYDALDISSRIKASYPRSKVDIAIVDAHKINHPLFSSRNSFDNNINHTSGINHFSTVANILLASNTTSRNSFVAENPLGALPNNGGDFFPFDFYGFSLGAASRPVGASTGSYFVVPLINENTGAESKEFFPIQPHHIMWLAAGNSLYKCPTARAGWSIDCLDSPENKWKLKSQSKAKLIATSLGFTGTIPKKQYVAMHMLMHDHELSRNVRCGGEAFRHILGNIDAVIVAAAPNNFNRQTRSDEHQVDFGLYQCPYNVIVTHGFDITTAYGDAAIIKGASPFYINAQRQPGSFDGNFFAMPYGNIIGSRFVADEYYYQTGNSFSQPVLAGLIGGLLTIPSITASGGYIRHLLDYTQRYAHLSNWDDILRLSGLNLNPEQLVEYERYFPIRNYGLPIPNPPCALYHAVTSTRFMTYEEVLYKLGPDRVQAYLVDTGCLRYQ